MSKIRKETNTGYEIPQTFFDEHPLKEVSPATLIAFQMDLMFDEEVLEMMRQASGAFVSEERKKQEEDARATIDGISTVKDLVRCMQKLNDNQLRASLVAKADELGAEAWQEVTDRLKRSGNDTFIENAILLLSRGDDSYIDQLQEGLMEIKSLYAKSGICVLLAYRKRYTALPAIMELFKELSVSGDADSENLCQGPLYAVYRLMNQPAK